MPPRVRYTREAVADAAYQLAREAGAQAVNARAVAERLGCSTQPLFRAFSSMDQLRAEVARRARQEYDGRMARALARRDIPPYKASGMAYVTFAREEPQLFRLLYMRDRTGEKRDAGDDPNIGALYALIMESRGCTLEEARLVHLRMWVYAHGLATMVATHYADFTDEEISQLLTLQYLGSR